MLATLYHTIAMRFWYFATDILDENGVQSDTCSERALKHQDWLFRQEEELSVKLRKRY